MDAAAMELLGEILERVRAIEAALKPRRLTRRDRERLGPLLVAVGGRFASNPFQVKDVLADPTLRLVAGDPTPTALGGLLSRGAADRRPLAGGLIVEACGGRRGNATRWRLLRVTS